jgi:hypothetical protein
MPDIKSGRVHILRQLAVPGGVAAEDTGNHLLLSVTGRSERCRSEQGFTNVKVLKGGVEAWKAAGYSMT